MTSTWEPRDLESVSVELVAPEIGGLLTPGCTTLISAEPEAGKTNLCLALAVDVIRAGGAVVWVDLEMGLRQLVTRCNEFGMTDEERTQLTVLTPEEPLRHGSEHAEVVDRLVAGIKPNLVVVDAMTGLLELHGLTANDGVQVETLYRTVIDRFRAHGAAVVILDHLTKDRENRGRWAIGSERKVGRADVHLGLECVKPFSRGHDGLVRIRVHKDRQGTLARPIAGELELLSGAGGTIEYSFRIGGRAASGDESNESWWPAGYGEKVSRHLESCDGAVSRNAIESAVGGNAKYVRLAIDRLISDGFALERAGARGARLVESIKPFREQGDPA